MPSRKPSSPSPVPDTGDDDASPSDALALAEEAEAEAEEAEAAAAAARARARAIRLRREAAEAAAQDSPADEVPVEEPSVEEAPVDEDAPETIQPEADEPEAANDPVADLPGPRKGLRLPGGRPAKIVGVSVAVIAIVALLAASGYMVWHHQQAQNEQRRAAEFAAAARQGVVTLMSLDFNHAKEDVQRIIDSSTGEFKQDFENTAEDFTKVAEQSKVVTEATVNSTAVDSMTDDSAVVLVAATSNITNAAGAKQDPRNWRLSVTVARDGDQIKLSKVEFVP